MATGMVIGLAIGAGTTEEIEVIRKVEVETEVVSQACIDGMAASENLVWGLYDANEYALEAIDHMIEGRHDEGSVSLLRMSAMMAGAEGEVDTWATGIEECVSSSR